MMHFFRNSLYALLSVKKSSTDVLNTMQTQYTMTSDHPKFYYVVGLGTKAVNRNR